MTHQDLPAQIEVYEVGGRRLYIKAAARNFAISEDDVTPEELIAIARDILEQRARRAEDQIEMAAA